MKNITKTINPIHFEDLEPKRFEDLVRQLLYDFRHWYMLEATGRSGSDDGFDARGWERYIISQDVSDDEQEDNIPINENRIWLIQCKREKTITPKKMAQYLDEIFKNCNEKLYGFIFVAPCNLSKTTRDTFINRVRQEGIQEFQIWGNGELEDQLFQPKNDHLLFAYFGISLKIRQQSVKSSVSHMLKIKRKIVNTLCKINQSFRSVIVKHAETDDENIKCDYLGLDISGIKLSIGKYYGYYDHKNNSWDCSTLDYNKTYSTYKEFRQEEIKEDKEFLELIPEDNRCIVELRVTIPFNLIIDIDDINSRPNVGTFTPDILVLFNNEIDECFSEKQFIKHEIPPNQSSFDFLDKNKRGNLLPTKIRK